VTGVGETPQERLWRDRAEAFIGLVAPALDLLLNVGDRLSRILSRGESDYYPIRPAGEAFEIEAARRDARRRAEQTAD